MSKAPVDTSAVQQRARVEDKRARQPAPVGLLGAGRASEVMTRTSTVNRGPRTVGGWSTTDTSGRVVPCPFHIHAVEGFCFQTVSEAPVHGAGRSAAVVCRWVLPLSHTWLNFVGASGQGGANKCQKKQRKKAKNCNKMHAQNRNAPSNASLTLAESNALKQWKSSGRSEYNYQIQRHATSASD